MNNRVLVVDDDPDIVENLKLVLEPEDLEVACAPNGRVALDILARADPLPSVILLDLMMPVMDGFQFRKAQLADARIASVPVIVLTADGHVSAKTAQLGAAAGLGKPFDIDELMSLVGRVIG
ncbi:MAG: response regulator [Polyangiaceae bacterium]|nr:response regulator [Polyangiaceae bacterium]